MLITQITTWEGTPAAIEGVVVGSRKPHQFMRVSARRIRGLCGQYRVAMSTALSTWSTSTRSRHTGDSLTRSSMGSGGPR
jgi:hypothetical protein